MPISLSFLSVLEAIAGSLSQAFFLGEFEEEKRTLRQDETDVALRFLFPERAFTLLRRNRLLGWILLSFCIPSILAGLAMGLGSGVTTVLQASTAVSASSASDLRPSIPTFID